jgi:hypothetical protein
LVLNQVWNITKGRTIHNDRSLTTKMDKS